MHWQRMATQTQIEAKLPSLIHSHQMDKWTHPFYFCIHWEESENCKCYFTHLPCCRDETIIPLLHLYQVIVIFSAPAIHIIWTEPLPLFLYCYLCPSEPIFRSCTHPLGCEWFLHLGLHGLYIYLIFRCSIPVQACSQPQLSVHCKSLKTFLIGHQE